MEFINAPNAPKALGPYSHAVIWNKTLNISGQLGINPDTNELLEGVEEQTHQALKNLRSIVEYAGSEMDNLIKVIIYLDDIADFTKVNKIYETYFEKNYPTRVVLGVDSLPANALIEITAEAAITKG